VYDDQLSGMLHNHTNTRTHILHHRHKLTCSASGCCIRRERGVHGQLHKPNFCFSCMAHALQQRTFSVMTHDCMCIHLAPHAQISATQHRCIISCSVIETFKQSILTRTHQHIAHSSLLKSTHVQSLNIHQTTCIEHMR
jgi:hypothetical protein